MTPGTVSKARLALREGLPGWVTLTHSGARIRPLQLGRQLFLAALALGGLGAGAIAATGNLPLGGRFLQAAALCAALSALLWSPSTASIECGQLN